MRRDGVLIAEDFFDGIGKRVITAAAAVGFVAAQHRRLHVLRDRAGATVGQKVNKDVFAVEQKRVHACLENGFFAMLARSAFDRLDDADAEGFGDVGEVFHDRFLLSVEKCESGTRRKWREEELWKIGRKNVIQIEPPDAGEYGDVHVISLKLLRGSDCCPLAIM